MRFKFAGQWLHDSTWHPHDVQVNGSLVYEAVDIVEASVKRFYARGNRQTDISFSVPRAFATVKEAEVWLLTGPGSFPSAGELEIVCGFAGDTQSLIFASAILHTAPTWTHTGILVAQTFQLVAGLPETSTPTPLIEGGTDTVILADIDTLTTAAETHAVSWPAQSGPPDAVHVVYLKPSASGDNVAASVQADTLAADGMTAELNAPAQAGAKLSWIAIWKN